MRSSQWFLTTLREVPSDAEVISHQLMLRAGMIRKLGAGLYTWLPLGLRVLRKIEAIVREEMNRIQAIELLMPAIQPAELWKETGRWETFGDQLLMIQDHQERDYCFGPTHEEVITDLMRNELRSYKQLPRHFYQIQTKFRDEIRPRFGVMRAREFIMKDAYSFHLTEESLKTTYDEMLTVYSTILNRLGLSYRAVEADTGAIGGAASHEFQVLANSGEDIIFYSDESNYAANIEQATSLTPEPAIMMNAPLMSTVETVHHKTIADVAAYLAVLPQQIVKTLIVEGDDEPLIALVLRGDDELNEIKAAKHPLIKSPLSFVDEKEIKQWMNVSPGSIGPVHLSIPIIVDHHALAMPSFICGANQDGKHLRDVVWQRDAIFQEAADLRCVQEGDASPDGKGRLRSCRGIEVGHVFQLGDKYAKAMNAHVLNEQGQLQTMLMGCYGLGITRLVAAAIEQHHDEKGILWPLSIAPFSVVIIPINAHRAPQVMKAANELYETFLASGIDVLLDDRNERPGVLFSDSDLIGIPHRIVVSERHLQEEVVEYKARHSDKIHYLSFTEVLSIL